MAYVVARRNGRFEVRESLHTSKGPRARSLAGFKVLTEKVLAVAAQRATRTFDRRAVIASGRRAGASVTAIADAVPTDAGPADTGLADAGPADTPTLGAIAATTTTEAAEGRGGSDVNGASKRFVEASRRMARSLERASSTRRADPGASLIDLLGFADSVRLSRPPRRFEPLAFPPLARLIENRQVASSPPVVRPLAAGPL